MGGRGSLETVIASGRIRYLDRIGLLGDNRRVGRFSETTTQIRPFHMAPNFMEQLDIFLFDRDRLRIGTLIQHT